jgi:hypothetical protein
MFTESRLIEVTSTATESISGEGKAIENAKTGKLTAVVAVMYLNGKTKVYLHSANSHKKRDPNRHKRGMLYGTVMISVNSILALTYSCASK